MSEPDKEHEKAVREAMESAGGRMEQEEVIESVDASEEAVLSALKSLMRRGEVSYGVEWDLVLEDDGLRADGGSKYGDKLPEGGTADLYADDEGNGADWTEETSARSIDIEVQLHEEGYQNDQKWTVHCSDPFEDHTVVARFGVEHQNKGNYWRPGDRWDDAVDFEDLPLPVRRRVAAVLNRSLDEITPEHRTVHREDGMGMADEAGDRDE